jgi:hypothetical protein
MMNIGNVLAIFGEDESANGVRLVEVKMMVWSAGPIASYNRGKARLDKARASVTFGS